VKPTAAWLANRSIPPSVVVPEVPVRNVHAASAWLSNAFGFIPRLVIGDHRIQMRVVGDGGSGDVVLVGSPSPAPTSVMVRIEDVDGHCAHARAAGAEIRREPTDYPYGERQYTAIDPDGHRWTFSQTIADIDPATWGGALA